MGRWPGLANAVLEEGANHAFETDDRDVPSKHSSGHLRLASGSACTWTSQLAGAQLLADNLRAGIEDA